MHESRVRMFTLPIVVLFVAVFSSLAQTTKPSSVPPYMNPTLPMNERVDDLVARMTLEEKASQLVNQARAIPRLQVPAYDWWSEALQESPMLEPPRCFRSRLDWRRLLMFL